MDIIGIREGLLNKDSLYVKLALRVSFIFNKCSEVSEIISEQWVPVE